MLCPIGQSNEKPPLQVLAKWREYVTLYINNLSKYWSLYAGTEIPANADMHDYMTPGNYYHPQSATVKSLLNCPMDRAFQLKVVAPIGNSSGGYIIQEYIAYDGSSVVKVHYTSEQKKWLNPVVYATKDDLSNYWSLISSISISEKADMNSFMTPGNYSCDANTTVKTLSNCPVTQAFLMKVYYPINGGNYIIQEYTPNDGGLIVRRVYDGYSKTWTMKKVVFS